VQCKLHITRIQQETLKYECYDTEFVEHNYVLRN